MKTILLIEDDENLSRGIAFTFEKNGYHAVSVSGITEGKQLLEQHGVDLIILDLMLPDGNGMDLCKEIRTYSKIPIIMLTACDLETDEVQGLMSGADDYITKPFSLSVLRLEYSPDAFGEYFAYTSMQNGIENLTEEKFSRVHCRC